jgi:hypothetical protein
MGAEHTKQAADETVRVAGASPLDADVRETLESHLFTAEAIEFAKRQELELRQKLLDLPDRSPDVHGQRRLREVMDDMRPRVPLRDLADFEAMYQEVVVGMADLRYITSAEFLAAFDAVLYALGAHMRKVKRETPSATFGTQLRLDANWKKSSTITTLLALARLPFDVVSPYSDSRRLGACAAVYLFDDVAYSGLQMTGWVRNLRENGVPNTFAVVPFVHFLDCSVERDLDMVKPFREVLAPEISGIVEALSTDLPKIWVSDHEYTDGKKHTTLTYLQFKMPDVASLPTWVWQPNPFDTCLDDLSYNDCSTSLGTLFDEVVKEQLLAGKTVPRTIKGCHPLVTVEKGYRCFPTPYKEWLRELSRKVPSGILGKWWKLMIQAANTKGWRFAYDAGRGSAVADVLLSTAADGQIALYEAYAVPAWVVEPATGPAAVAGKTVAKFEHGPGWRYEVTSNEVTSSEEDGETPVHDGLGVDTWTVDAFGPGSLVAVVNGTLTSWKNGRLHDPDSTTPAVIAGKWYCRFQEGALRLCREVPDHMLSTLDNLVARFCPPRHRSKRMRGMHKRRLAPDSADERAPATSSSSHGHKRRPAPDSADERAPATSSSSHGDTRRPAADSADERTPATSSSSHVQNLLAPASSRNKWRTIFSKIFTANDLGPGILILQEPLVVDTKHETQHDDEDESLEEENEGVGVLEKWVYRDFLYHLQILLPKVVSVRFVKGADTVGVGLDQLRVLLAEVKALQRLTGVMGVERLFGAVVSPFTKAHLARLQVIVEDLSSFRRPSRRELADLSATLVAILSAIHSRGVVHCNLTPDNILVRYHDDTRAYDVRLIGFEAACVFHFDAVVQQFTTLVSGVVPRMAPEGAPYTGPELWRYLTARDMDMMRAITGTAPSP